MTVSIHITQCPRGGKHGVLLATLRGGLLAEKQFKAFVLVGKNGERSGQRTLHVKGLAKALRVFRMNAIPYTVALDVSLSEADEPKGVRYVVPDPPSGEVYVGRHPLEERRWLATTKRLPPGAQWSAYTAWSVYDPTYSARMVTRTDLGRFLLGLERADVDVNALDADHAELTQARDEAKSAQKKEKRVFLAPKPAPEPVIVSATGKKSLIPKFTVRQHPTYWTKLHISVSNDPKSFPAQQKAYLAAPSEADPDLGGRQIDKNKSTTYVSDLTNVSQNVLILAGNLSIPLFPRPSLSCVL